MDFYRGKLEHLPLAGSGDGVNELNTVQWLLAGVVALPGLAFLVLSIGWMLGWTPIERTIAQLTGLISVLECCFAVALAWAMYPTAERRFVRFGNWFGIGSYSFPLMLFADLIRCPSSFTL